jgi:hypothetical protein
MLEFQGSPTGASDLWSEKAFWFRAADRRRGRPRHAGGVATRNGDLFVGWGALPYISEFSPSGQLLFNAELPAGLTSYRAYRLPWHPAG